ncbi:MAG: hypothetical protein J6T48_00510 [Bacteroidales bacterium]|nr:hypothetical protein [Bacteroidales bacterium]
MMAKTQKLSELSQSFSFTEYNPKIIILVEFRLAKVILQTMVDNISSACSDLFYIAGKVMGLASTGLTWFAVCSLFNFAIVIP